MEKYRINASITVSCFTHVEAESKEEALQLAENRSVGVLCAGAFGFESENKEWIIDELDGEPQNPEVDKI